MLIQPGHNSPSILDSIKLVRTGSKRWIDVYTLDKEGKPTDVDETIDDVTEEPKGMLELFVSDFSNVPMFSESYLETDPSERRIKKMGDGRYGVHWGADGETDRTGTYLFNWAVRETDGAEENYRTQVIEIVDPSVLSLLPRLRLQLDKSIKVINPEEYCNLGYSDAQLMMFLKSGLERIAAAQPYPAWLDMSKFPVNVAGELLISCAVISALESQYLFAVDTDVPSFSDQGHAFTITHATQIQSLYTSMVSTVTPRIREFKLRYVGLGSICAEFRAGWGFYQMVAASPPGSLFRGHFSNTHRM